MQKTSATYKLCKKLHFQLTSIGGDLEKLPLSEVEREEMDNHLIFVQKKLIEYKGRKDLTLPLNKM